MTKLLFLLVSGVSLLAETPMVLAIRNARVVTVSGPEITRGTVVVRNGLIEAVGESVSIPQDAWIVDGEGLIVYPGLIDGLSTLGLPDMAPAAPTAGGRGGGRPAAPTAPAATPAAPPARGPGDRPMATTWVLASGQMQASHSGIEAALHSGFTFALT